MLGLCVGPSGTKHTESEAVSFCCGSSDSRAKASGQRVALSRARMAMLHAATEG